MRNGVDTATLFATLNAVKQAPEAARFQFRAHNEWSAARTTAAPSRTTSVSARSARTSALHVRRRPPRRPGGPITGRPRSSSCSTRWPLASPPAWPTSPPPGGSNSPRCVRRSRVTSTSTAFSASMPRCGMATRRSPSASRSRATLRPRSSRDRRESRARSAVYDVITNGVRPHRGGHPLTLAESASRLSPQARTSVLAGPWPAARRFGHRAGYRPRPDSGRSGPARPERLTRSATEQSMSTRNIQHYEPGTATPRLQVFSIFPPSLRAAPAGTLENESDQVPPAGGPSAEGRSRDQPSCRPP